MYVSKISVKNFRLLRDAELCLEKQSTLIVGRNNSGKTSFTELFRRLTSEGTPRFQLEDFSLGVCEEFWKAFELKQQNKEEQEIRATLPVIEINLSIEYGDASNDIGPLGNFIIDLNLGCTQAKANLIYALEEGKIEALFADIPMEKDKFFKEIKDRITKLYQISLEVVDPNDPDNKKPLDFPNMRALLRTGFINAQRSLDSTSKGEKAVIGKILEAIFTKAASDNADPNDRTAAEELKSAVTDIQEGIDTNFNEQLVKLIPAFELFGYPGLTDPNLRTETTLKVEQLLSNHTSVGYEGIEGINLPESYNGLGPRNLIFILLRLYEFFREFTTQQSTSGIQLLFIEEPEVHLHPQMQIVFIRKLEEIATFFSEKYNDGKPWPVQFIVTTHSSHIANEASFNSMRYFLTQPSSGAPAFFETEIKDLRTGLGSEPPENQEFLHKYMTLTQCDLLFADKAILIEGATERLLLPEFIRKKDEVLPPEEKLGSQYLSVMEVGGAHAHRFFNLLKFLNLKTLVVTDLDTVNVGDANKKCKVSAGTHSSNSCINDWFSSNGGARPTKDVLLGKNMDDKTIENRHLAYQIPESRDEPCGRSFEEAFVLANSGMFEIEGATAEEKEESAMVFVQGLNKTDFALEHAINNTDWSVPLYISEGLGWLAEANNTDAEVEIADADVETIKPEEIQPEDGKDG